MHTELEVIELPKKWQAQTTILDVFNNPILMLHVDRAVDTLIKLKAIGVHLAIDDFVTGYSSLSYLKQFPIDRLKIDRLFIKSITSDPDDQAIASAVISMAESMKLQVTAEGVETAGQFQFLRKEKCDEAQG